MQHAVSCTSALMQYMFYCTYPILYKCADVPPQPAAPGNVMPQEDKAHGSVSLKTYCLYFIAGGGYALLPFLVFLFLLAEVHMYNPLRLAVVRRSCKMVV